jgi:CxxC-x17-CxxC domain-containing protein
MLTSDKMLSCRDCSKQFAFTTSEQEFYAQKGFTSDPSRCPDCREARKSQRGTTGSNTRHDDRPARQTFKATCSDCGGVAELPFNPSGDRPVYCRDCFGKRRA